MAATLFDAEPRFGLVPRDYQRENHAKCVELFDKGEPGVLCRAATGTGKTPMACMLIDTWLSRGDDFKCMVISYETQLVHQFAQEIFEFLKITPTIEMESLHADLSARVVVASRASLLRHKPPTDEIVEQLKTAGIDPGQCDHLACAKLLRALMKGTVDLDELRQFVDEWHTQAEVKDGFYSRVHKFDPAINWLQIWDEAHRHAHHLESVGHVADWFARNKNSKRFGTTATPKRSDGVSIGDKMFPGVSLDFPLYSPVRSCAVKAGWAVPYVQKYIKVEEVDFKSINRIAGDFDDADLDRVLNREATLAKMVEPLLDLCGERRTLVFSPSVDMAKNVASYINARRRCKCTCGKEKWQARKLIGDGAKCECGRLVEPSDAVTDADLADSLWGEVPQDERWQVYAKHQTGKIQFLSVCGLCREGYNDPDVSCVAVFRPVTRKASSLAEQMKGRGCRPARAIIAKLNHCTDAEMRLKMIAESAKPDCLIVDLTGITGLGDCASTVSIYAEGLDDEVRERAVDELEKGGLQEIVDVQQVIVKAKEQVEAEREQRRKEREQQEAWDRAMAERRAKAGASVKYDSTDVGYSADHSEEATDNQYKYIELLGMKIHPMMHKRKAGRIIDQLLRRMPLEQIAAQSRLAPEDWERVGPSPKQAGFARWKGVPISRARSKYDASLLIDAFTDPPAFVKKFTEQLNLATKEERLNALGCDLNLVKGVLPSAWWDHCKQAGAKRRELLKRAQSEKKGEKWEDIPL
jgi:superfamily II DNA or RNA helicase